MCFPVEGGINPPIFWLLCWHLPQVSRDILRDFLYQFRQDSIGGPFRFYIACPALNCDKSPLVVVLLPPLLRRFILWRVWRAIHGVNKSHSHGRENARLLSCGGSFHALKFNIAHWSYPAQASARGIACVRQYRGGGIYPPLPYHAALVTRRTVTEGLRRFTALAMTLWSGIIIDPLPRPSVPEHSRHLSH